jgi:diphosphomevalonate decarboxylase
MNADIQRRRRAAADAVLGDRRSMPPRGDAEAFAPANIALVKYWGKRDAALNLPVTGSLSVSLGDAGTRTAIRPADRDSLRMNVNLIDPAAPAARRVSEFLDLVRPSSAAGFAVETVNSVPTAAGVASSASGFAALVRALDGLYGWDLNPAEMSVLARLGSGSACRSLWDGFVEWIPGTDSEGADSRGAPIDVRWPELRIGVWVLDDAPKAVASREGMRRTVETSPLYPAWPAVVARDLIEVRQAVAGRDLERLGRVAEGNALAMHATAIAARPSALYWRPESVAAMARITALRAGGMPVWFTLDAGPNLKLIFEAASGAALTREIPALRSLAPFG